MCGVQREAQRKDYNQPKFFIAGAMIVASPP